MRLLITLYLSTFAFTGYGQQYKTVEGNINFFSEAPIENITADNSAGASAFDGSTGEIVFSVPIRSFKFRKSLMQEHFNERFMESEKYPKATFKGTVMGFDNKVGIQKVSAKGDMTIHGVTKSIMVEGTMEFRDGKIYLDTAFPIRVEDYEIEIPQILWRNIAEEVEVTINFVYKPVE